MADVSRKTVTIKVDIDSDQENDEIEQNVLENARMRISPLLGTALAIHDDSMRVTVKPA